MTAIRALSKLTALIILAAAFAGMAVANAEADLASQTLGAAAQTTPTIDGVASAGEWADADTVVEDVTADDGSIQELTVAVKNDAQYLYMLVKITNADYSDPAEPYYDFINIYFDNDNDGQIEVGENIWAIRYDGAGNNDAHNPAGVPHWSSFDADTGGTEDVDAAVSHTNPVPNGYGTYTAEFAGLLDSGDAGKDFALGPGDTVGFAVQMADGDPYTSSQPPPQGSFMAPATVPWVSPGWAEIYIHEAGEHDVAVVSVSADKTSVAQGEIIEVTVEVENQGDFDESTTVSFTDGITVYDSEDIELDEGTGPQQVKLYIDTAGMDAGDHGTGSEIAPVAGETDLGDNGMPLAITVYPTMWNDATGHLDLSPGENLAISGGATLTGDITVDGGNLILTGGATLDGSILGDYGGDITIRGGSAVTGNIDHVGGTLLITEESIVGGNGIRANSAGTHILGGSTIGGNLEFFDSPLVFLDDATVNGYLSMEATSAGFAGDTVDISMANVDVGLGINIDHTSAGFTGTDYGISIFDTRPGAGLVIDVPSSGIYVDQLMISLKETTVVDDLVIDVPSSGIQAGDMEILLEGCEAGNDLVIDVSSAGIQAGDFILSLDGKGTDNVGGDLVIDVSSAGIVADKFSLEVDGMDVANDLVIDVSSAGFQADAIELEISDTLVDGAMKLFGNELVSGLGQSPFIVSDCEVQGGVEFDQVGLELTGASIGGNLKLTEIEAVMGVEPSPFKLEDSLIGGNVKAFGNELVSGLGESPFIVEDTDIGGNFEADQLGVHMDGCTVDGNVKVTEAEQVMGVEPSPFKIEGTSISGNVVAHGTELVSGVGQSPFIVADSEIGGNMDVDQLSLSMMGDWMGALSGGLTATDAASVSVEGYSIGKNVNLDDIASVELTDSTAGGHVTIENADEVSIDGVPVEKNLIIEDADLVSIDGVPVEMDLIIGDSGTVSIDGVPVERDLQINNVDVLSIDGVPVERDVLIDNIGTLSIDGVPVERDMLIDNAETVSIDGVPVERDMMVDNAGTVSIDGVPVERNLVVRGDEDIDIAGSIIDGDASITGNGDISLSGNTFAGDLSVAAPHYDLDVRGDAELPDSLLAAVDSLIADIVANPASNVEAEFTIVLKVVNGQLKKDIVSVEQGALSTGQTQMLAGLYDIALTGINGIDDGLIQIDGFEHGDIRFPY